MQPFFSVIIPTLNEENYLPKLLTSLCKQTDNDFEVIIVDCQSKDRTKEVAAKFRDRLRLQFFEHKAAHVASQRNFGAEKAFGKYLVFLDADTGIYSSFIKKMKNVVVKKKGLVFIPYVNPMEKSKYPEMEIIYPLINLIVELSQNFRKALSAGGNMIWEKNFFHLVGGFDEKLEVTEDHDIIRKAHLWGVRVQFTHAVKINFSLRRMKQEGRLKLFYKVLISHLHLAFNDKLQKKLFEYEMGGHLYNKKTQLKAKQKSLIFSDYKVFVKKTKKIFAKLLKEI